MLLSNRQSWIHVLIGWLLRSFFWLLYNPFAWIYDTVASTVSLGSWKDWVRTVIPFLPNGPILEIGHGPGHLQTDLHKSGRIVYGLDVSPWMSRIAHKRLRRSGLHATLVHGTAFHLPFPKDQFNSVVATFPSEYIASIETLSEITRVLRRHGRLVILPYAWITGDKWLEKLAAWLFQITGQVPRSQPSGEPPSGIHGQWVEMLTNTAQQLGYLVTFKEVNLHSSRVLIILVEKMN